MTDIAYEADWILHEELPEIAPDIHARIHRRIVALVEQSIREERDRCVEHCRQRAALWDRTALRTSSLPPAVAEARSRSNEAKYLADLLEVATPAADSRESDS